jgi:hypothetical protein
MQIRDSYQEWISEPTRARSPELDFGVWWTLYPDDPPATPRLAMLGSQLVGVLSAEAGGRWRVSWIDDTGELYAKHLATDAMIVLGHYPTREAVEVRMKGWAEGGAKALTVFFLRELLADEAAADRYEPPAVLASSADIEGQEDGWPYGIV